MAEFKPTLVMRICNKLGTINIVYGAFILCRIIAIGICLAICYIIIHLIRSNWSVF